MGTGLCKYMKKLLAAVVDPAAGAEAFQVDEQRKRGRRCAMLGLGWAGLG